MKRRYNHLFTILISFCSLSLHAQVFSVGTDANLSMKSGTILSAENLQIIPSTDYTISSNMLSAASGASGNIVIANIKTVYKFSNIVSSFKGQFKLGYSDAELNGISEAGLKFLYNSGSAWIQDNSSNVDVSNNLVQSSLLNSVNVKEITAGKSLLVPLISVTPLSQTICSGSEITPIVFSDINNEVGTTFSWTRDNPSNIKGISAASGSGKAITGVFTNNSTVPQTTIFTITATNSKGSSSMTVSLTVNPALEIIKQPSVISVKTGTNTSFDLVASGVSMTYQWQLSTDNGGNWTDLQNNAVYAGVTSTKVNLTKVTFIMNGFLYRCIVFSNTCGPKVISATAKLSIKDANSMLSVFAPLSVQMESTEKISIFANPNPSASIFKLNVSAPGNELVEIVVTDLRGSIIKSFSIKPNEFIQFGDDLAAATYILIARQGVFTTNKRIVKY